MPERNDYDHAYLETPDVARRVVEQLNSEVADARRLRLRSHPSLDALAQAVDLNLAVVFDFRGELERIDGLTHALALARNLERIDGLTFVLDLVAADTSPVDPIPTDTSPTDTSPHGPAGGWTRAGELASDLAEDLRRIDTVARQRSASHDQPAAGDVGVGAFGAGDFARADAIARGLAYDTAVRLVEVLALTAAEAADLDVAEVDVAEVDVAEVDVAEVDAGEADVEEMAAHSEIVAGGGPAERLTAIASGLRTARSDFVDADLRTSDLAGIAVTEGSAVVTDATTGMVVDLRGVRWSAATQWPPGWADRLRHNSVEVTPGEFEIR